MTPPLSASHLSLEGRSLQHMFPLNFNRPERNHPMCLLFRLYERCLNTFFVSFLLLLTGIRLVSGAGMNELLELMEDRTIPISNGSALDVSYFGTEFHSTLDK